MTKDQAWNKGYDLASDTDYESNLQYFKDVVLISSKKEIAEIPADIYPEFVKGISANWEDSVSNGAIWHEDDCDGEYDCDCMK